MLIISLIVAVVLVVVDQIIKVIVDLNMELGQVIPVIKFGENEIFNLKYVLNDGAGFSLFGGQTIFLILTTSLSLIAVLVFMIKFAPKNKILFTALTLVLAGGLGNLIDRIFRDGLVIDYIEAGFINFPIFNFADICVVFGVGFLLVWYIQTEIAEYKAKKAKEVEKLQAESEDNG